MSSQQKKFHTYVICFMTVSVVLIETLIAVITVYYLFFFKVPYTCPLGWDMVLYVYYFIIII